MQTFIHCLNYIRTISMCIHVNKLVNYIYVMYENANFVNILHKICSFLCSPFISITKSFKYKYYRLNIKAIVLK